MLWFLLLSSSLWAADPYVVVLGVAQDGGYPQAGSPASQDSERIGKKHVSCLGIVDPDHSQRWLIEATPDFPEQLRMLDAVAPGKQRPGLDGIFLTHAHIGHYTGLINLGHEVMGARHINVFAMPRMVRFLSENGPWDQLVRYHNISLTPISAGEPVRLNARLTVTPVLVPHRQEYSEVVGFRIEGPTRSILFIPDIDSWKDWEAWGISIEEEISLVDVAYLDGTFFADGEVKGRDMSSFPHPRIEETVAKLRILPEDERNKVKFIHLNHTNPALDSQSPECAWIEKRGFHVAEELEEQGL